MKKVLVVNDCKFESLIMKDFLSDIGYSVEVTNEYNVFIQIKTFKPDIVIVNLIMKDTTGDTIISHVKRTHPEIICLLSSCDLLKLEDFAHSKVDEVIHTPVSRSRLSEILDETLSKYDTKNVIKKDINEIFQRLNSKRNSNDKDINTTVLQEVILTSTANVYLFCPYCGYKLEEKDKNFLFCPYCGQRIKS